MAQQSNNGTRITGRHIVEALKTDGWVWRGGGGTGQGMCRCPAHDDSTASLAVADKGERIIINCFAGCSFPNIVRELRALGLWEVWDGDGRRAAPRRYASRRAQVQAATVPAEVPEDADDGDPDAEYISPEPEPDEIARQDAARAVWHRATPIGHDAARLYLWSRRLDLKRIPPTLRFVPQLFYAKSEKLYPALIGAIANSERRVTAVQRIWVTETLDTVNGACPKNTKAPLPRPKKTLGVMGDGAIRLAPAGRTLGIAEGIETGLSAQQYFSLPVWVSCGAWRMDRLWLPEEVEHVIIFGDNGETGHEAAHKASLAYHARGIPCDIEFPPDEYADWNDVLTETRRGNK